MEPSLEAGPDVAGYAYTPAPGNPCGAVNASAADARPTASQTLERSQQEKS